MRPQDLVTELEEGENGRFTLEEQFGRAVLCVYPPGRAGRPVRATDVIARLDLFALEGYDPKHVDEIVLMAEGEPADICAWKAPDPVDANFTVELAPGAMQAYIEITPPKFDGRWPGASELFAALRAAGVMRGLLEDDIRRLAARDWTGIDLLARSEEPGDEVVPVGVGGIPLGPGSAPGRTVRILAARGEPAREGRSGYLRHYFAANPRSAPVVTVDEPTRVDYRNLRVIQTCEQDALLVEVIPPEKGVAGFTVTGQVLEPEPVSAARLFAGENVRFTDDETAPYATAPGQVTITGAGEDIGTDRRARVDVRDILNLEEVNFSTGNVEFPGTIVVEGTVLDGFEVRARGDIIVQRSVSNVKLIAGGDVILAGGVVGRGASYIQAGGDLFARFAQNSTLYAAGCIFIEEASMNSRLTAGANIAVEGGRGEIIGGSALCAGLVRARKLGSRGESQTLITVGLKPETMEQLRVLEEEYEDTRKTLARVQTALAQYAESERLGRELKDEDRATAAKLGILEERYAGLLTGLDHQRERIYSSIKPDPAAQVVAVEAFFPGAEISFGAGVKRYRLENRAHYGYTRFVLVGDQIQLRGSE